MKRIVIGLILTLVLFMFCSTVFAFKLPDTGQMKCYNTAGTEIPCSRTGQDGEYVINPLSYTDNGNGTVSDNNTGLTWQKCSMGQTDDELCSGTASAYNWYQASGTYDATYNPSSENVCGALERGGYSDWRLPSKKELKSIVDYSIPYPDPTLDTAFFPNTITSFYWSSTTVANGPGFAWGFYFDGSMITHYPKDYD